MLDCTLQVTGLTFEYNGTLSSETCAPQPDREAAIPNVRGISYKDFSCGVPSLREVIHREEP